MKEILKGKVVIVGVGNTLKRDDGFGPALIELLKAKTDAVCIDAGSAPENYVGKIAKIKPDTILIADAAELGLAPGEYKLLGKEDILKSGFTTHDISPHMFMDFLEKETKADIYMLGLQPEDVSFGEGMSDCVKSAMDKIVEEMTDA